jgi:hypothetical protein
MDGDMESNAPAAAVLDLACRNDSVLSFSQLNETIVTFHRDGRVEINPKYSADEAAKAFWNAVIRMNPFQPGNDSEERAVTNTALCAAVKRVREAHGDTLARFSQRTGISMNSISRFELGKAIPKHTYVLWRLGRAADAGGLSTERELFEQAHLEAVKARKYLPLVDDAQDA